MKFIGKGSFSKVYLQDCNSKVLILSLDKAKEALSKNWHDNTTGIFPSCDRIDFETYEMKYYPRLRSLKNNLNPDQWELYKQLRELFDGLLYPRNYYNNYQYLYDVFSDSSLNEEVKDDVLSMLDSLANWGTDICFEISPRNVAVDNGKLILLDCFFFKKDLLKSRK